MRTSLTINQVIDEWLADSDVGAITRRSYRCKIQLWFRWLSAQRIDPRHPRRSNVIDYKHHLETSRHTELTVNGYIKVVKIFYRYVEERKYYDNIAAGIRSSSRYTGHRKAPLSQAESQSLIDSIDTRTEIGMRDRLMVSLMLFYGLRTCEIERLDINDFDRDGDRYLMRIQRKGRKEKHERIAVSRNIIDMLEDYTSCRNFQISDPLFVCHASNRHSQRLHRGGISEIVKQRLRSIGVDRANATAHSLRHTCATMLIKSGVSLDDVRDILGHTDSATTRIYIGRAQEEKLLNNNPSILIETMLTKTQKQP